MVGFYPATYELAEEEAVIKEMRSEVRLEDQIHTMVCLAGARRRSLSCAHLLQAHCLPQIRCVSSWINSVSSARTQPTCAPFCSAQCRHVPLLPLCLVHDITHFQVLLCPAVLQQHLRQA